MQSTTSSPVFVEDPISLGESFDTEMIEAWIYPSDCPKRLSSIGHCLHWRLLSIKHLFPTYRLCLGPWFTLLAWCCTICMPAMKLAMYDTVTFEWEKRRICNASPKTG